MPKQRNKIRILFRYGVMTVFFVIVAVFIVISLVITTTINRNAWEKEANQQIGRERVGEPERGSILAANGSILACNMLVYDVKLDMQHPKMTSNKLNLPGLDSLADYLDVHYPRPADLRCRPTRRPNARGARGSAVSSQSPKTSATGPWCWHAALTS